MLISDFTIIGEKFFSVRKSLGLTQSEVAEAAGLSDRTYADIERGTVNMRVGTLIQICNALHITPNDILVEENVSLPDTQTELLERLNLCSLKEQKTILQILTVYLNSINK